MNNREALWAISSDVIDLFKNDFGVLHGMAKKIAYDNIMQKPDADIDKVLEIIKIRLNAVDDKNVRKK